MSEERLREALNRVHDELQGGTPMGEQTLELLRNVLEDIERRARSGQAAAEEDEAADEADESLAERVQEASLELHGAHPRLTAALEEMATVLGRMGI
jgi:hypothetical protein